MEHCDFEEYHKDEEFPPPLPRLIWPKGEVRENGGHGTSRTKLLALRSGCYLIKCRLHDPDEPGGTVPYCGTLRNEVSAQGMVASGDLYLHKDLDPPVPSHGIPIFSIANYRYYLRATELTILDSEPDGFEVALECFSYRSRAWWRQERDFRALLRRLPAPPDFPSAEDYFQGELFDEDGNLTGEITMGWVSEMLRRASIDLGSVDSNVKSPPLTITHPRINEDIGWRDIFAAVGWDVSVRGPELRNGSSASGEEDDSSVEGKIWTSSELHAEFAKWRPAKSDLLDREWRYLLLCVPRLESSYRGLMFDTSIGGSGNRRPREGAALAANAKFEKERWGEKYGEKKLYQCPQLYFRTAIHELGHAMGLVHTAKQARHNGFMARLDDIRERYLKSERPGEDELLETLEWAFAPHDAWRLKHFPDYTVRPGGQPFNRKWKERLSRSHDTADGPEPRPSELPGPLHFRVRPSPGREIVPLGAPVRIELSLENNLKAPVIVSPLKLAAGHLTVGVVGPDGRARGVLPLIHGLEGDGDLLEPKGEDESKKRHSLTLLHGEDGPLFPMPGLYWIRIEWDGLLQIELDGLPQGESLRLQDRCPVLVQDANDEDHALAALDILSNPETLSVLAIGGSRFQAEDSINHTIKTSDVLRPHYQFIMVEYHIYLDSLEKLSDPNLKLTDETIMTVAETRRLSGYIMDKAKAAKEKSKSTEKTLSDLIKVLEANKEKLIAILDPKGKNQSQPRMNPRIAAS